MKKSISIISIILLLLTIFALPSFADAMAYDVEEADYYVYVATPDGGLNMRYGPGTDYDKVMEGRIPDGVELYISLVSGNWGYTSYNGYEGWVALKQTSKTPPVSQPENTPSATPTPQPDISETETPAPEKTETPDVSANPTQAVKPVNSVLTNQILLIAIIILLLIILSLLVVILINRKSRK